MKEKIRIASGLFTLNLFQGLWRKENISFKTKDAEMNSGLSKRI
jgi:hypothetical protein